MLFFIQDILSHMEAIMYSDVDILYLRPIDEVWRSIGRFNSTQIASMSPGSEDGAPIPVYNPQFTRHPYYGKYGLNSGLMPMNMTRMRMLDLPSRLTKIYKEYESKMTMGDQDLFNIYFAFNPGECLAFYQ